MAPFKIALFSVWILILSSITLGEVFAQPEPTEEEATFTGSRLDISSLLRLVIFIVIAAIAGIAILVLRKRKLVF